MGARGPVPRENSVTHHVPKQNPKVLDSPAEPPAVPELHFEPHPATLAWWESWTSSPQTSLFTSTDWQALVRCAYLVESYFAEKPTAQLAAEIRQVEAKLGATISDRDRLGWKFKDKPAEDTDDAPQPERTDPRTAGPG
jgi:hypothetical protein